MADESAKDVLHVRTIEVFTLNLLGYWRLS